MPDVHFVPVLMATVVALVLSGIYYGVLAGRLAMASGTPPTEPTVWRIGAEGLRSLVTVSVVAVLAEATGTEGLTGGLVLGLLLWVGFPLTLWAGAMLHERTPWRLAAIHGGDWLMKLVVVALIVSMWR